MTSGLISADFFVDDEYERRTVLNHGLLKRVRANIYNDRSDVEVAVALLRLAHEEFEAYVTRKSDVTREIYTTGYGEEVVEARRTDDEDIRLVLRTSRRLAERLGTSFDLPFSDYSTFRTYWVNNGNWSSPQDACDILNRCFEPMHVELEEFEDSELAASLARPIIGHAGLGWPNVDIEISELRRQFRTARTTQDYRNVGNSCVAVLERLSEVVFDLELHLRDGEQEPPVASTKQRFDRFVEHAEPGSKVRGVARAAIGLAQAVKHHPAPTRRDAGIAGDSVIMLANLFRWLAEG